MVFKRAFLADGGAMDGVSSSELLLRSMLPSLLKVCFLCWRRTRPRVLPAQSAITLPGGARHEHLRRPLQAPSPAPQLIAAGIDNHGTHTVRGWGERARERKQLDGGVAACI